MELEWPCGMKQTTDEGFHIFEINAEQRNYRVEDAIEELSWRREADALDSNVRLPCPLHGTECPPRRSRDVR